jgi:hypothetical protein
MTTKPKSLSMATRALDLLRQRGRRLMLTHTNAGGGGCVYHVVPNGGHVEPDVARRIIQREDVQPFDSGLIPGCPQSWRLGPWR